MFKSFSIALFSLLALVACKTDMAEEVENKTISGVGTTTTVNYSSTVNLTISGADNTVTIASNIKELKVSGVDSIVTVNDGVVIESITLSGVDIVISLPTGYSTNVTDSGVNNSITYR